MFRIYICDNDRSFAENLSGMIKEELDGNCLVETFTSAKTLKKIFCDNPLPPDMLFTGIQLQDGDGIETVRQIREKNAAIKVIYVTGYPKKSGLVFETRPSYLLLKPVMQDKLKKALDMVVKAINSEKNDTVSFETSSLTHIRIYKDGIKYVESYLHTTKIITDNGTFEIRKKLDDVAEILGENFSRVHKSFLVNMRNISLIKSCQIKLFSGEEIPVSKARNKQVNDDFLLFLDGKKPTWPGYPYRRVKPIP